MDTKSREVRKNAFAGVGECRLHADSRGMTPGQSTANDSRLARALRVSLAVLLFGGTALVTLHYWLGVGGGLHDVIGTAIYDAVVLGAGLACLTRASAYGRERSAWILIRLAILAWGPAEVYWAVAIENNPNAPYPSPADIGYLAFYPLAYAGLALLVRARAPELNSRLWMDGLIAALGAAALGAAFIFDFVAEKAEGSALEVATTLAYPRATSPCWRWSSAWSRSPAGAQAAPGHCCWPAWRRWSWPTSPSPCN